MIYRKMDYIRFDVKNPHCLHVMVSNRAYCSIINETFEHGTDETGGLLMGYIINRKWYVVDVIDPGTNNTIHETGLFQWDQHYVNAMAARMRKLYRVQPTILGFWHRHPGSMDFFSQQDVESTQKNLQGAKQGLISMLVNIDPALRMTFYYCNGPHFMPVRYDVGDEYFPVELLEYATPEEISRRHAGSRNPVRISYRRIIQPPTAPGTAPKPSFRAENDGAPVIREEPVVPVRPEAPVPEIPEEDAPRMAEEEPIQQPIEPAEPVTETPAGNTPEEEVRQEPEEAELPAEADVPAEEVPEETSEEVPEEAAEEAVEEVPEEAAEEEEAPVITELPMEPETREEEEEPEEEEEEDDEDDEEAEPEEETPPEEGEKKQEKKKFDLPKLTKPVTDLFHKKDK